MLLQTSIQSALAEPFPQKCQMLNSVLESCVDHQDLHAALEQIVQSIIVNTSEYSSSSATPSTSAFCTTKTATAGCYPWPLKTTVRSRHEFQHDCMYRFLSASSTFWSSILLLESTDTALTFSVQLDQLPSQLRSRIAAGQSSLSNQLTQNMLYLSPLEYYLVHFLSLLYDTTSSSRSAYNELFDTIELDSLYGDLLNNYLGYFLPIDHHYSPYHHHQSTCSYASATTTTTANASHSHQSPAALSPSPSPSPRYNIASASASALFPTGSASSAQASLFRHVRPHHRSLIKSTSGGGGSPIDQQQQQRHSSSLIDSENATTGANKTLANGKRSPNRSRIEQFASPSLSSSSSSSPAMASSGRRCSCDTRHIDTFLRLVNECLVYPFTHLTSVDAAPHDFYAQHFAAAHHPHPHLLRQYYRQQQQQHQQQQQQQQRLIAPSSSSPPLGTGWSLRSGSSSPPPSPPSSPLSKRKQSPINHHHHHLLCTTTEQRALSHASSYQLKKQQLLQQQQQHQQHQQQPPQHTLPAHLYNDFKEKRMSSVDIISALNMVLRHSHLFANSPPSGPTPVSSPSKETPPRRSIIMDRSSMHHHHHVQETTLRSPLDDIKNTLFKKYWRQSFFAFFNFHFEHWSLTNAIIKRVIELWLTYIQAWSFAASAASAGSMANDDAVDMNNNESGNESNSLQQRSVASERAERQQQTRGQFVRDNYLVCVDIYQLIVKRYCIVDLTNRDNLRLLNRVLTCFLNAKELIKKNDLIYANFQHVYYEGSGGGGGGKGGLRGDANMADIGDNFVELNKLVHSFVPLIGIENLKNVSNFYDILLNSKQNIFSFLRDKSKHESLLKRAYNSMFASGEQDNYLANMSKSELSKLARQTERSLELIQAFYEVDWPNESELQQQQQQQQQQHNRLPSTPIISHDVVMSVSPSTSSSASTTTTTTGEQHTRLNVKPAEKIRDSTSQQHRRCGDARRIDPHFENEYLVALLQALADYINDKYGDELTALYERRDLLGCCTRRLLYVAGEQAHAQASEPQPASATSPRAAHMSSVLSKPRVSLRFLASYKTMAYIFAALVIVRIILQMIFV